MNRACGSSSVDFIVNTFERTYPKVLSPGYIQEMVDDHCYPFVRRVVLINNVENRADAEEMARSRQATGEITEYYFVADLLDRTLREAELVLTDLQPTIHYTDWALTAIFLQGSDFVVHCDADVRMKEPQDWITPSLDLMARDGRIAVANPNWTKDTLNQEARELQGEFGIGYGFSDQLFLVRRSEFAQPIYKFHAPISLRYPLSASGRIFEQMADSYMRVNGRMRATLVAATYIHGADEGGTHPRLKGIAKLRRLRNRGLLSLMRMLRLKHHCYHI